MDADRIRDFAILRATQRLVGPDLYEFESWAAMAPDHEKAIFAETSDLMAALILSNLIPRTPSDSVKSRVLQKIRHSNPSTVPSQKGINSSNGFHFIGESEGTWKHLPSFGARLKELSYYPDKGYSVFLIELDPGGRLPPHHHHDMEEVFLLYGDLKTQGMVLGRGDYFRADADTDHAELVSEFGCRALLISAVENYPRGTVRTYDAVKRIWDKVRHLITR